MNITATYLSERRAAVEKQIAHHKAIINACDGALQEIDAQIAYLAKPEQPEVATAATPPATAPQ